MHWHLKGLVQKSLSCAPGGRLLNDRLQRSFGELRHFERNVAGKVEDWKQSLRYLGDVGFSIRAGVLVEIGTGWYPALPICFSLAGITRITTYDTVRHLDASLTFRMIAALEAHLDSIAEACGTRAAEVRERHQRLLRAKDVYSLLKLAEVEYQAPADARLTQLPSNSVDLVYSNSVMEHVRKDVIEDLMHESVRILRPGGLALHNVACNDHYAHMDRRISFVNYLQFSESQWRWWNNSLQYQNRLRAPEFLEMAAKAGLNVIYKQTAVRPGTFDALAKFEVAPEFQRFAPEDLAVTSVDFIARKPR
jgi:SAM-dependent methyltransferase